MKISKNFESGTFVTGCNYWASHAGIYMWRDWSPETVSADLELMGANRLSMLRIFPLWPDFQPLTAMGMHGGGKMIYLNDEPLPDTEAGRAGVDDEMMARFRFLADEAEKNGIRLIVGLITGWMSGRMFIPPALESLNPLTDPLSIKWQVRFVRYFVKRMKDHPAIAAWDLGNECNCLGPVENRDQAWNWTHAIASAIRLEDPARPVVSGMHSLHMDCKRPWRIVDQAELTDILTTHPYPLFTPHCNREPFDTLRNTLHATVESCLYSDLGGGKPCLPEEVGCLGPMICSEARAGAHLNSALFSCWAHDLRGLLWWCAFDQDHLKYPPYEWVALERELGLFRADYSAKPVGRVMRKFNEVLDALPFRRLPKRRIDAVCLLTSGQAHWDVALGSFILAKQAGFDLAFHDAEQPLPEAALYIMPSIRNCNVITARRYHELLARVEKGAKLLVTSGNGMLQPFENVFGLRVDYSHEDQYQETFSIDGVEGKFTLPLEFRQKLLAVDAEVQGTNENGDPMLVHRSCGKGELWFLNVPMESILAETNGAFYGADMQPFYRIYRKFFHAAGVERLIERENPAVGVTEHPLDDDSVLCVLVNYCPETALTGLKLASGWEIAEALYGDAAEIPGNDAAVIRIRRTP